jgi:hypothetical protein
MTVVRSTALSATPGIGVQLVVPLVSHRYNLVMILRSQASPAESTIGEADDIHNVMHDYMTWRRVL